MDPVDEHRPRRSPVVGLVLAASALGCGSGGGNEPHPVRVKLVVVVEHPGIDQTERRFECLCVCARRDVSVEGDARNLRPVSGRRSRRYRGADCRGEGLRLGPEERGLQKRLALQNARVHDADRGRSVGWRIDRRRVVELERQRLRDDDAGDGGKIDQGDVVAVVERFDRAPGVAANSKGCKRRLPRSIDNAPSIGVTNCSTARTACPCS